MKGLELSRAYWEKCALPLFRRELPAFLERAAVGLVGEGSECFGFDDESPKTMIGGRDFVYGCLKANGRNGRTPWKPCLPACPIPMRGSLPAWRPPSVWAGWAVAH